MGWFSDLMLGGQMNQSGTTMQNAGTTMQPTETVLSQTLGSLSQTIPSGGGYVTTTQNPNNGTWIIRDPYTDRPSLCSQLLLRLDPTGKHENMQLFEFINVHKCSDSLYAVFVVKNGKPLIIEDGDLFPSDTLITQLRLLMG
jgi:hypothetical protein